MKKLFLSLLLAASATTVLGFAACNENNKEESFVVTFNAQDGVFENGESSLSITVKKGETATAANEPLLIGYDFTGWTLNGSAYDFSAGITGNLTLTAAYQKMSDVSLTLSSGEGFAYEIDGSSYSDTHTITLPYNGLAEFSLDINPYYTQNATVTVGKTVLTANEDGVYSFRVTENSIVTVLDIMESYSSMAGQGTETEPFFITQPVDLLYIAEQVNAGVSTYTTGYYQLEADLDFKGETIPVIGDGSPVGSGENATSAYFGGYFNGMGHTISNFKIESENSPFVGLFGYVVADLQDTNLATVHNVNLKDFEIVASLESSDEIMGVGALIGYGIGANVYTTKIQGGSINVYGNNNYPAFMGGVMGVQQTAYLEDYGSRVSSSVAYASVTETEIFGYEGIIPAGGGIVGYAYVPDYLSTAYVINSHSDATIFGAGNAGGIVGQLSAHASVYSSYSTGSISASSEINDTANLKAYCYASAGGVVGYAENETMIVDCFSAASLSADAALGGAYQSTGGIVARVDDALTYSLDADEALLVNNYYAEDGVDSENGIDLTDPAFVKEKLGWPEYNWVFPEKGYPTINLDSSEEINFVLTVKYIGETSGGATETTVTVENSYAPLSFMILNNLLYEYLLGDNELISCGYYLDEALTQNVPYSFVLHKDATLYMGFADYTEIDGSYEMVIGGGETAGITLFADGTYQYEDGALTTGGYYHYNGEYVIFENARFARYASATPTLAQMESMMFKGVLTDGKLYLYDGTHFTEDAPLVALSEYGFKGEYYADGAEYYFYKDFTGVKKTVSSTAFTYTLNGETLTLSGGVQATGTYRDGVVTLASDTLSAFDEFKGTWVRSSSYHAEYTFDGKGNWFYEYYGYTRTGMSAQKNVLRSASGTYTVSDGIATLSNGLLADFDENGVLVLDDDGAYIEYYKQHSHLGEWVAFVGGNEVKLTLGGLPASGLGRGEIEHVDGLVYSLYYAREKDGRITLYNEAILFGYLTYNANSDTLTATLYDPASYAVDTETYYTFYHYDEYKGEWVSENNTLEFVDFNGLGSYDIASGYLALEGFININGTKVSYTLEGSTLDGSFTYNGVTYTMTFDERTGKIVVGFNGDSAVLERKDEYAALDLLDKNGNKYVFDGKGNLLSGGALTVVTKAGAETVYTYKNTAEGTKLYNGETLVGSFGITGKVYAFTLSGQTTSVYLNTVYTGVWGVNGEFTTLEIGPMNLDGEMEGKYGNKTTTFYYDNENYCSFVGLDGVSTTYLLRLTNGELAMSTSTVLGLSSYIICAPIDELYGNDWSKANGPFQVIYRFDGLSASTSTFGSAEKLIGSATAGYSSTAFSYQYDPEDGCIRLWATEGGEMYVLEWVDASATGAYTCGDGRAFVLTAIDSLHLVAAVDTETEIVYTFDGAGTVTASDGKTYEYEITASDSVRKTITVVLTDGVGKTYTAVVHYGNDNETITIQENIV